MADKKRVLLADDEADLITIMSTMLTTHGFYEIVTAKDGLEAYRKARNQKFDLICSDFKMPKLNGVELIGALREALYNKDTPILIVSGYTAEIKAEIDASGLKKITLIEKPVSEEKFLKSVELAFKNETDVVQVKAKPKLDVGFINPFIESTVKTIQTMGSLQNITADKPRVLKKGEEVPTDISGVVTMISPQFNGSLAVCFPAATFLSIINNMLGEKQTAITNENKDAAAELTNIIFGQTKSILNEKGYKLEKAIPSVITGKDHTVSNDPSVTVMMIPFKSSGGDFYIQVVLGDAK